MRIRPYVSLDEQFVAQGWRLLNEDTEMRDKSREYLRGRHEEGRTITIDVYRPAAPCRFHRHLSRYGNREFAFITFCER